MPLVLGTPVIRGSASTAIRSARAVALKIAFADVMAIAAVVQDDVQIHQRVGRHGLPEILDQFAVEIADFLRWNRRLKHQRIAAAQIDAPSSPASLPSAA